MAEDLRTTVEFLTSIEGRLEILEALDDQSLSQEEMSDRPVSEKTVERWLDDLIARGWIEQSEGQYRVSTTGRTILQGYEQIRSSVPQEALANGSEDASNAEIREQIAFIASSENRLRVLRALQNQIVQQNELAQQLSVSRTTVHRRTRDLEDQDWIREVTGSEQYELTTHGDELLEAYEDVSEMVETVRDAEAFLSALTADQIEIPVEVLEAGRVVVASPENPHTPVMDFLQNLRFDDTVRFRSMAPVVSEVYNTEIGEYVGSDIQMELIIDESTLDTSKSKNPEGLEDALGAGNLELYLHPGDVSFGLVIFNDEMAMMGAFDEEGNHRAGLIGEDETAVNWMIDVYKMYKQDVQQVEHIPREASP